jgi:Peptidase family C25/Propeptide_C25
MKSKISLTIFLLSSLIFPQESLKVLSSSTNALVIEYTPQYSDTFQVKIEGEDYYNIQTTDGVLDYENPGIPAIPYSLINIGVPSEFGNSLQVLRSSFNEKKGKIVPVQKMVKDGELNDLVYEISPEYNNQLPEPELVKFGNFGNSRNLDIQTIVINPVYFDSKSNTIKLYTNITFRINFNQNQPKGSVATKDDLLEGSVINYDVAKRWIKVPNKLQKIVTSSVLATGEWVRFEAPDEGIYKIDRAMLTSFGFNPSNIDPRTIKIYNNGGKVLPEKPEDSRPVDLTENAIKIIGEDDGTFDTGDYILFYGRGSSFRDFNQATGKIERFNHPYSKKNFYWITYGGANGIRIQDEPGLTTNADFIQSTTRAFKDSEVDKINLANTGREFFGDDFSENIPSRSYINKLDNRDNSVPVKYKLRFANASQNNLPIKIYENTSPIYNSSLAGYGTQPYWVAVPSIIEATFTGTISDNRSVLKVEVNPGSIQQTAYIDYYEIEYSSQLMPVDNKLIFFSPDSNNIVEYYLSGFSSSNIKVFDVTDFSNIKNVTGQVSGGEFRFRMQENSGNIRKYVAVGNDQFYTPSNSESVPNSDIRGYDAGVKFIIITHKNFREAADRLQSYRQNEAQIPISTKIFDVNEIYNEFSCGVVDVSAIRDFIRYAYNNWQIKPEYVMLLGKGTYDYKNISGFGDNFIPTWQSQESIRLIYSYDSYSTDDFFMQILGNDTSPDIVVSRLTVSTLDEANNYISKVIRYETSGDKGSWRNLITLVSDDGLTLNGNDGSEHTAPSEYLAANTIPKSFDLKKIYLADYPAVITGNGRRKPSVNIDIINTINEGTLLINYIGHGNPELWAHEHVFDRATSFTQLHNDRYFFLCTATCDFGYFDIPNFQSSAEDLMFFANKGSIADFCSARLVFSTPNHALNYELVKNILSLPRDTLNLPIRIGNAVFKTKQHYNSINDQKFYLFGDPTLRLLIPEYSGAIDSINGQLLTTQIQIKALSHTKISGTILKPDSTVWNDYNGEGLLTIFDSERTKLLEEINYSVVIPGGIIFRGRVSVVNGEFTADFVVPKDISYENKNGKIIFYFFDSVSDGVAYTNKIIVGGTDTTAVNDGAGPDIEVYFDNAEFQNAYLVGPEPNMIVKLSDETGLNTTGTGVGHNLEAILNQNESNPINLSSYFTGELDAGGKIGEVNYKFNKLDNGDYTVLIKAWDVFNNFSNETTNFTVVNDDEMVIRDVYNYPNPFKTNTAFTFQLNQSPVDIKIRVYTIAGRIIKEIEENNITQRFVKIPWDGRDEDGDVIANGTYLYKIIVKTTDGSYSGSVLGKMAVIK